MKSEKITKEARRRSYDDACGTAHGLELVGDRWALLVIRELLLGARRFGDLRASLPGLSANVLTQRLAELEGAGILGRRRLPPPAGTQVYELTKWGYEAETLIQELGRWAARSPGHDPTLPLSPVSLMLSMRTMLDRELAAGLRLAVGFRFGEERFLARLVGSELPIVRVDTLEEAQAVFVAPAPPVLAGLFYGGVSAEVLEGEGVLRIEGDRAAALRYAGLFRLPPKAPAARSGRSVP